MNIKDRILYEDNHLIAINKLPGEIVQGDKTEDTPMSDDIKMYLKTEYNKPGNVYLAVIHRIDRPVSGVVFFAKTSKAAAKMTDLIKTNMFHKTYWAITCNRPTVENDNLVSFLYRNEKQNKSYVISQDEVAKNVGIDACNNQSLFVKGLKYQRAELNYRLLSRSDRYYLLEIDLITGRHHQIRAQLASLGCAIKGDLKYGAPRSNPDGSIALHARKVSFIHPIKKEPITVVAPLPSDNLWNSFNL